MATVTSILLLFLLKTCSSQTVENFFQDVNKIAGKLNSVAADIAWESMVNPGNTELPRQAAAYQKRRIGWQHRTCSRMETLYHNQLLNETQRRQAYLLCRGPKFTLEEARLTSNLYEELQSTYAEAEVCIPTDKDISSANLTETEDAILNYLSKVKEIFNLEHGLHVSFAAKIATFNGRKKRMNRLCLRGEDEFEKLMEFSRKEEVLRWLWLVWREKVGPTMKEPYRRLADVENVAARRNGYPNIGACWRDEQEMPGLRQQSRHLYNSISHLYRLLHGVVRFYLRKFYGDIVPKRGPIPAHLLGNLWSQNWEPLAPLMLPKDINLDVRIKQQNWTVDHMVKRAEDFYSSLGLPAMTDKFWRKSVFKRENDRERCHGTAADMFEDGDYRLLYCSGTSKEDLYVLHHELGHIQYYMAYENQPTIFRQANSALHETIGDTIMYGVLTPQHLHRLGLINDAELYTPNKPNNIIDANIVNAIEEDLTEVKNPKRRENKKRYTNYEEYDFENEDQMNHLNEHSHYDMIDKNSYDKYENVLDTLNSKEEEGSKDKTEGKLEDISTTTLKSNEEEAILKAGPDLFNSEDWTTDTILLFRLALNKIPQIPFALVIDEYRWMYFEDGVKRDRENKVFWDLVEEFQGVAPVGERGEEYFDVGAKFHVPDNTPYIRYFLSSFLQHQLFEKLCKAAVFGRRNADGPVPDSISLSRCDIYGSKAAGKILKDLMSRGHSQPWAEILHASINETDITASALLTYYQPLYDTLATFVHKYNVPIGW